MGQTRTQRLAKQIRDERGIKYTEALRIAQAEIAAEYADRNGTEGCADDPEGSSRHAYRLTVSSYHGIGVDRPDFRADENVYRCRACGDVFVAVDSEMEGRSDD
jgi:hypothetical protein